MQNISSELRPPNSVRAVFADGISSFQLPSDATFEELADRLGHLAERHQGAPIAFDMKLGILS